MNVSSAIFDYRLRLTLYCAEIASDSSSWPE